MKQTKNTFSLDDKVTWASENQISFTPMSRLLQSNIFIYCVIAQFVWYEKSITETSDFEFSKDSCRSADQTYLILPLASVDTFVIPCPCEGHLEMVLLAYKLYGILTSSTILQHWHSQMTSCIWGHWLDELHSLKSSEISNVS